MLIPESSKSFEKDIKRLQKAGGYDFSEFDKVLTMLINEVPLPPKYHNHKLIGQFSGYFDCHVKSNWLLIYKIVDDTLFLIRTGTHSEVLGI